MDVGIPSDLSNLLLSLVLAFYFIFSLVIAIYTAIENRSLAKHTGDIESKVHRLSLQLDQSREHLSRARDLVNKITVAELFFIYHPLSSEAKQGELYIENEENNLRWVNLLADKMELKGLILVIGDEELLKISISSASIKEETLSDHATRVKSEAESFHKRIYKLLGETFRESK